MLNYVSAKSLNGLGITTPTDYDTLVQYIRDNTDCDNIVELINTLPDGYIKEGDIFFDFTDDIDLLRLIVKKISRDELRELYDDTIGNPDDDIETQVELLSVLVKELGNTVEITNHNLAHLVGKKLSEFDNEYPVELSMDTLKYFLEEDVYEPELLLVLVRLVSVNTVDYDICESVIYYMMNDPYVLTRDNNMWNDVNVANEFVFRCIQTDMELIYKEEFSYLSELMDKDLPYYVLCYGMHRLTAKDILEQVEDFASMVNRWQKSDICECKMFEQLLKDCKSIDSEFYEKIKKHGLGYGANYQLETLVGYEGDEEEYESYDDDLGDVYSNEE